MSAGVINKTGEGIIVEIT